MTTRGAAVFGDGELTGRVVIRLMQAVTVGWVFAVGASVGSFLNVVVYRLPRGMRLSSPPSRCPGCGVRISRRDNVPVLGWLLLRGRCRACGAGIPVRYPLVEGAVGLVFVALFFVEFVSGGANLPVREPDAYAGFAGVVWDTEWGLAGLYAYHVCLCCVLLAMGLIVQDGHAVPGKLAGWGLGTGLLAGVVWPHLHPVPLMVPVPGWLAGLAANVEREVAWLPGDGVLRAGLSLRGLLDGVAGLCAGVGAGWLLSLGERGARRDVILAAGVVGTYLGWQAVIGVALAASLSWLAWRIVKRGTGVAARIPGVAWVGLAAFGQLTVWRWSSATPWWPGYRGWPWLVDVLGVFAGARVVSLGAVLVVVGAVGVVCRWVGAGEKAAEGRGGNAA